MYTERSNMLWSKEEYLNSHHTFQMLKNKTEDVQKEQKIEEKKLQDAGIASSKGRSMSLDELDEINDS